MYRWRKGIVAQLDDLEQRAESILSPELLERGAGQRPRNLLDLVQQCD
jgi:hypothetical protein